MTALVDPLSMFQLDGKVALVTGGGIGIGRATVAALAGADAAVAILDVDLTRAETAAREITTRGGMAAAHQADVTDKTSVERAIDAIVARHGGSIFWSTAQASASAVPRLNCRSPIGTRWSQST